MEGARPSIRAENDCSWWRKRHYAEFEPPQGWNAMQLQIICNKVMEVGKDRQHGRFLRAARAPIIRSGLPRNGLAARPQHAVAVRCFWLHPHAAARAVVEEALGVSRPGLSGGGR